MRRFFGGQKVQQGVYASLATGEIVQVHHHPWVLPGKAEIRYVKVSATLMMLLGPFAGLALVIFLPLVGIVGGAGLAAIRIGQGIAALGSRVLHPALVEWWTGDTYLAQKVSGKERGTTGKADQDTTELEREVAEQGIQALYASTGMDPRERQETEQKMAEQMEHDKK